MSGLPPQTLNPAEAGELLLGQADLALIAQAQRAAGVLHLELSDFARMAVERFVARADDEAWTTLISRMNSSDDPQGAAVVWIIRIAISNVEEMAG